MTIKIRELNAVRLNTTRVSKSISKMLEIWEIELPIFELKLHLELFRN